MASPIPDQVIARIRAATTVIDGGTALINNIHAMQEAAIAQSMALGATEDQLVPLQAVSDFLDTRVAVLANAIAEHTVAAGEVTSPNPNP